MANKNLPQTATPVFSLRNPHWQRIVIEGVREELQPVLTLRDFHYAWTWEVRHRLESEVVFAILAPTWRMVWVSVFLSRFRDKAIEISRALHGSSHWKREVPQLQTLPSASSSTL